MMKSDCIKQVPEIDARRRTPKYLQVVHSVTKAIKEGRYKKGDRIHSINELSNGCFLSRDTVQKAYSILEKERIIEAVPGKGFFIHRTNITVAHRVLLIFNKLSHYKRIIYDSFVQALGNKGVVDLKIHHSDLECFEEIIDTNAEDYDYFVVMPHFPGRESELTHLLNRISVEKVILLDKDLPFEHGYSAVYQDFENDIVCALENILGSLHKYEKLIFVNPVNSVYPTEILHGFRRFCQRHQFPCEVIPGFHITTPIQEKDAYIIIDDTDLARLVRSCDDRRLTIGQEIGAISYNDSPLKEILLGGITVLATNHHEMGKAAAGLILNNRQARIKSSFDICVRKSL